MCQIGKLSSKKRGSNVPPLFLISYMLLTVQPEGIPLSPDGYVTPYFLTNVPEEATPDNQYPSAPVAEIFLALHFT